MGGVRRISAMEDAPVTPAEAESAAAGAAEDDAPSHTELENLLRKATLQLLEDRAARADAVASVLPALDLILSGGEMSAEDRTVTLQHLRDWVAKQKEDLGVGASTVPQVRAVALRPRPAVYGSKF